MSNPKLTPEQIELLSTPPSSMDPSKLEKEALKCAAVSSLIIGVALAAYKFFK